MDNNAALVFTYTVFAIFFHHFLINVRCLLIDAFDENTGRGNATKEGKHLESTFKYIKHVLIPQCRYREKPTTTPIVALEGGKTLVAPWECGGSVKSNKEDDDDSVSATSRTSGTMSDESSSSSSSSSAPSDESTASAGTTGTKTIAASVTTWSQMETQDSVRRMMQKQTSVRGNARFH